MTTANLIIIYLYSYLPALFLVGFFWWLDRFDREPLFLVLLIFFWGAFGAGLLSYFWNTFIHIYLNLYTEGTAGGATDIITTVMVAPFVEELTKGSIILFLLWLGKVDNITDGILFGVVIGLGFAAAENVFYAEQTFDQRGELAMWNNLWFREIHTTLLHASATAVWGAMIAYSKYFKGFRFWFTLANGFILAMVTHGMWNFLASYVGMLKDEFNFIDVVMRFELVLIMGSLLSLFLFSVASESRVIVKELLEESEDGVIPREHIGFFASLVRHPKRHNLPKNLNPKTYAKLGVKLAFRKHEYRQNPSNRLNQEIRHLRKLLKDASEYTPESLSLFYGK